MSKARIVDGKALVVSGDASHNDDCCCDEEPISCCDSVTPFSVDVDFGFATGDMLACCQQMNGTYVLSLSDTEECVYFAVLDGPYADAATGTVTGSPQCDDPQPEACYELVVGTTTQRVFLERVTVTVRPSTDPSGVGYDVQINYVFRQVIRTATECTASLDGGTTYEFTDAAACITDGLALQSTFSAGNSSIGAIQDCTPDFPDGGPTLTINLL